jgi:hypothetical protein
MISHGHRDSWHTSPCWTGESSLSSGLNNELSNNPLTFEALRPNIPKAQAIALGQHFKELIGIAGPDHLVQS